MSTVASGPAAKAASPAPAASGSASGPAPDPLPLPGPAFFLAASETWGCTRCRGSLTGCVRCNPYKMAAWAAKQTAKEAAMQPAEEPVDPILAAMEPDESV